MCFEIVSVRHMSQTASRFCRKKYSWCSIEALTALFAICAENLCAEKLTRWITTQGHNNTELYLLHKFHNPPVLYILSHNHAPSCNRNVHMCAHFCYKMVHCGIFIWCIVGFGRWVFIHYDTMTCITGPLWGESTSDCITKGQCYLH